MSRFVRRLFLLVACAAGLAPVTAAEAQWYGRAGGPPPLYPYELQPGQSYAVEVAPGTYVIHHPSRRYASPAPNPRIRHRAARHQAAPRPKRTHANRALIEELRQRDARRAAKRAAKRAAIKRAAKVTAKKVTKKATKRADRHNDKDAGRKPDKIIHTRKIVREKPLVIETRRIVNDPPRVITRRHYVDDAPAPAPGGNEDPRVIHADAEITILGPDRMSIRLVRKGGERLDVSAGRPKKK